jgi:glutamate racemase
MVGIFDSGKGGEAALSSFRKMRPTCDVAFLADTDNAPYGNKSEDELISLVCNDIERLVVLGASVVLMACCTASTVFCRLPEKFRRISIPIIDPSAKMACRVSKNGRIGVLSTERTMKSGCFAREIKRLRQGSEVISVAAPELVTLAERRAFEKDLSADEEKLIDNALSSLIGTGIDTVVLGCTHFSYFEEYIGRKLGVRTVNCAVIGATELLKSKESFLLGRGLTVYI